MPCKRKKKAGNKSEVDKVGMKILKVLAEINAPARCGEIAKKAGIPTCRVTGKLRSLANKGLVDKPEKGKYLISEAGMMLIK